MHIHELVDFEHSNFEAMPSDHEEVTYNSDDSSISDLLDGGEDGWEDVEQDEERVSVVSLFDDKTFTSAKDMLVYCRDNYGFDMWKIRRDLGESGGRRAKANGL